MAETLKPNTPKRPIGVTRERVRELDAKGLSRNEISALLGVSSQAVQYHLKRLKDAAA